MSIYDEIGALEEGDAQEHILTIKCVGILAMLGLTMLFSLLPYKTYSCEHRQRLISFANCFGGGVLFGTIFLHLIPEVSEQMNTYLEKTKKTMPIPLAETIEVLGFCLILFLETLFDELSVRRLKHRIFADDCEKCEKEHNDLHVVENISAEECNQKAIPIAPQDEITPADKTSMIGTTGTTPKVCAVEPRYNIDILIASLFVHSVFEGGAVGVEKHTQPLLALMGAIMIHKCAIALTIGSRLVTQEISFKKGCLYAAVFAVATPIGIVVGLAVEAKLTGSTLLLVTAVIQALGTGIFLYITFAEILFPELKNKVDMKFKIPSICLGILVIGLSCLLHEMGHDHDAHHHD